MGNDGEKEQAEGILRKQDARKDSLEGTVEAEERGIQRMDEAIQERDTA